MTQTELAVCINPSVNKSIVTTSGIRTADAQWLDDRAGGGMNEVDIPAPWQSLLILAEYMDRAIGNASRKLLLVVINRGVRPGRIGLTRPF